MSYASTKLESAGTMRHLKIEQLASAAVALFRIALRIDAERCEALRCEYNARGPCNCDSAQLHNEAVVESEAVSVNICIQDAEDPSTK